MAIVVATVLAACYPVPPDPAWDAADDPVRDIGERTPRVLILGDSIADQHGSHAVVALREVGVEVAINAWWGWNLFTRDQYDMGVTNANPPYGTLMYSASETVDGYDPDVVVFYSNHNYWPPYPRDAAGREILPGSPQFAQMVQTQLVELMERLTAKGAVVYMVKPMPGISRSTAATNAFWQASLPMRDTLGFGVINSGDVVADLEGDRTEELLDCGGRSVRVRPEDDIHLTYFGAGLMGSITARGVAGALGIPLRGTTAPAELPAALLPYGTGYRMVTCDGATFRGASLGDSLGGVALSSRRDNGDAVVGATNTPAATGAWAVTAKGKVISYADAPVFGQVTGLGDAQAIGIVATASGQGYWIATNQGVVHHFGNASALGDLAGSGETVVAMAGTPDHTGYWLLTASGRVVGFGSAADYGDLEGALPPSPVVALAAHPSGNGYWVLDAAGNVHPFGAAQGFGSAADQRLLRVIRWGGLGDFDIEVVPASREPTSAVTLLPTPSGNGYWVWLANGAVCHFGDATTLGGIHRGQLDFPMVLLGLPFYGAGNCAQGLDPVPYPED